MQWLLFLQCIQPMLFLFSRLYNTVIFWKMKRYFHIFFYYFQLDTLRNSCRVKPNNWSIGKFPSPGFNPAQATCGVSIEAEHFSCHPSCKRGQLASWDQFCMLKHGRPPPPRCWRVHTPGLYLTRLPASCSISVPLRCPYRQSDPWLPLWMLDPRGDPAPTGHLT